MEYTDLYIPFECDFRNMKKKQAQEFFDWYMCKIPERINILKAKVNEDNECCTFDYSPESLCGLWKWFEKRIVFEELSDEEYKEKLNKFPEWMHPHVGKEKISYETLLYISDIAMYFGEVVERNNKSIYWGYVTKPKKLDSVNKPVLLGFKKKMDLDPRNIVEVCTRKSREETNPKRLYNTYKTWLKFIDSESNNDVNNSI